MMARKTRRRCNKWNVTSTICGTAISNVATLVDATLVDATLVDATLVDATLVDATLVDTPSPNILNVYARVTRWVDDYSKRAGQGDNTN